MNGQATWKAAAPRLLGAAFLIVFVLSVITQLPQLPTDGGGHEMLADVAASAPLLRLIIVAELGNSLAIGVLATLLYLALRPRHPVAALVALGWWWTEAVVLAVSKVGTAALIGLSLEFAAAPAPDQAQYQALAGALHTVDAVGYQIHVLFFSIGAVVWYSLLFDARYIPRWLSGWGAGAVALLAIDTLLVLIDPGRTSEALLSLPYLPVEPAVGVWLLVSAAPPTMTTMTTRQGAPAPSVLGGASGVAERANAAALLAASDAPRPMTRGGRGACRGWRPPRRVLGWWPVGRAD